MNRVIGSGVSALFSADWKEWCCAGLPQTATVLYHAGLGSPAPKIRRFGSPVTAHPFLQAGGPAYFHRFSASPGTLSPTPDVAASRARSWLGRGVV